jgi:hypothetical protein
MNSRLILTLVELRYKLLWAQMRTRNGRVALLTLGYLLLAVLLLLFLFGGFGAAQAAVQSGQSELIARSILGGLFSSATAVAVLSGLGIRDAFTDAALRRYPLNARGRLAVRHITGFLEPVWLLILALEAGLATGMYVFAGGNASPAWVAVLILVVTNYLLARDLVCIAAGLMRFRGGKAVLLAAIPGTALLAPLLGPGIAKHAAFSGACVRVLRFSPPFTAAALLLPGTASTAMANLGILLLWALGLLGLLPRLERWSIAPVSAQAAGALWGSRYERIASLFGPRMAPLIAKSLRYYSRCPRVWYMCFAALVIIATQLAGTPVHRDPRERFLLALCLFTLAGICGPLPVSANQFGYEALSFRRYLLLPVSPGLVMRANSYVSLLVGGAEILFLILLWLAFAPMAFDMRMPLMLLGSGVTAMYLFNAIAVWMSVLAARAADYDVLVGFNVSVAAAVSLQIILWPAAIGGQILRAYVAPDIVLRHWWISIPAVPLAVAVYVVSLHRAIAALPANSERLMSRLEGRD